MFRLCAFADEYGSKLEDQIKGLKKNEIALIEFRSVDGKNVLDLSEEEVSDCFHRLRCAGISVWSVGSPLGKVEIGCDFAEYEVNVRRICRTANLLHCDKVRVFSFFHAYERTQEMLSHMRRMVDIAREYGIQLYHENEKEVYGDTVQRVDELMRRVVGLKFVYDPANFVQCGEDVAKAMDMLCDRISYYHIKDAVAATGELVPAGYGDGRIAELIERLKDRDTVLTLEPHLAMFEGYGAIDKTQMKNRLTFADNAQAFDFAVAALKKLLNDCGYTQVGHTFIPRERE